MSKPSIFCDDCGTAYKSSVSHCRFCGKQKKNTVIKKPAQPVQPASQSVDYTVDYDPYDVDDQRWFDDDQDYYDY